MKTISNRFGFRIIFQPAYSNAVQAALVAERLADACKHPAHIFWADSMSLLQTDIINWNHILGSRQVTDAYLLALAVMHEGSFVTFDRGISSGTVFGAEPKHLVILNV